MFLIDRLKAYLLILTGLLWSNFNLAIDFLDSIQTSSKSTEILKLYESQSLSFNETDNLFNLNSDKLSLIKNDVYVIHQLAWALYKKRNSQKSEAVLILEKLKPNLIETKISGTNISSYYTLYGILLYELHQSQRAREKFKQGLFFNIQNNDAIGEKGNLINIGNTYFIEENLDSALYWFTKAKKYSHLDEFETNRKNNIATIYMNLGNEDRAIKIYNTLLNGKQNSLTNHASTHFNLALIYYKTVRLDSSIFHLTEVLKVQNQWSEQLRLSEVYKLLSDCFEKKKNIHQALHFLKMADSVKQIEKFPEHTKIIEKIKSNYEKKILENQANYSKKEVEILNDKKLVLQVFLVITILMMSIITVLLIVKNRQNKILLKQNIELAKSETIPVFKDDNLEEAELALVQKFEDYLLDKKEFTNSSVTLDKASKKLKTNRTYLSKAINKHYNCNFNEILNRFRIQEARKLLIDQKYDHYSIEGIAKTIGYNTISTFNSSFKKETGLTPSYFRKNKLNH